MSVCSNLSTCASCIASGCYFTGLKILQCLCQATKSTLSDTVWILKEPTQCGSYEELFCPAVGSSTPSPPSGPSEQDAFSGWKFFGIVVGALMLFAVCCCCCFCCCCKYSHQVIRCLHPIGIAQEMLMDRIVGLFRWCRGGIQDANNFLFGEREERWWDRAEEAAEADNRRNGRSHHSTNNSYRTFKNPPGSDSTTNISSLSSTSNRTTTSTLVFDGQETTNSAAAAPAAADPAVASTSTSTSAANDRCDNCGQAEHGAQNCDNQPTAGGSNTPRSSRNPNPSYVF